MGSRLPVIQGGSFAFIVPTIAILSLPHFKCPIGKHLQVNSDFHNEILNFLCKDWGANSTVQQSMCEADNATAWYTSSNSSGNSSLDCFQELWQVRMREISGAIAVASLLQISIGYFGIIGLLLKKITPLTISPAITMIGVSLFEVAGKFASKHWGIAIL